jgi:hypothetical protein
MQTTNRCTVSDSLPKPLQTIQDAIADMQNKVQERWSTWNAVDNPAQFREMELEVAQLGRQMADAITAEILKSRVADPELQANCTQAAKTDRSLRSGGQRKVQVTLLGGQQVECQVEYYKPNRRTSKERRRRTRRRGKGGTGLYPVLAALGIWFGVTPALAAEVCRQVADSDSVRSGRSALDRRGADLGHKPTLRLVNRFSARAVEQRQQWLDKARKEVPKEGPLSGQRVVIATDGGRLRERRPAKSGRRRAKTGHRGYDAPWREPKLLTIYVVDDNGDPIDHFQPVYDGTLGNADALFEMFTGYLRVLGAHQAKELIVAGDGARWIWERVDQLVEQIGIDKTKVIQVIDWCHAVSVLHEIAAVPASWSSSDQAAWVGQAKRRLARGQIDELVAMIDELAVGRRAKDILEHRDYFARNKARMQYAEFKRAGVPRGSGAIESAIRRIINMRMKSNGMFWLEVNAEGMLLLRSYLKADYFDALVDWSLAAAVPWWQPNGAIPSSPLGMA